MTAAPDSDGGLLGLRSAGTRALLAEFGSLADVLAYHQRLSAEPLPGQVDAVAAARTVLLRFGSRAHAQRAVPVLRALDVAGFSAGDSELVTLDVAYDGEDLAAVAEHLGLSRDALIDWHSQQRWTGAFGGFAPGFTYCVAQDESRQVPRRETPRTEVPAGSVAIAGEFSAVYPRASPGGWQLIGRTEAAMWDLGRDSPALVRPGDTVQYRPVRASSTLGSRRQEREGAQDAAGAPAATGQGDGAAERTSAEGPAGRTSAEGPAGRTSGDGPAGPALTVLAPGLQALVEDTGRAGLSDLGVSRSGAVDEPAARQANRLVGNAGDAAVLEVLYGGLTLRAERTVTLAVTGADVALAVTGPAGGARRPELRRAFVLVAGETLAVESPSRGIRSVLALRGGIAADPVLGSASADTLSGLGPAPLQPGDALVQAGPAPAAVQDGAQPSTLRLAEEGPTELRFTLGPRQDWFEEREIDRLGEQTWIVSQDSNRVGVRLEPDPQDPGAEPLSRARRDELPSEGVVRGSLQMPPSGQPVLFLNDHPVTGGYPVIGVVVDEDLSIAAQVAPGTGIKLVAVDPDTLRPLRAPSPAGTDAPVDPAEPAGHAKPEGHPGRAAHEDHADPASGGSR